MSDKWSPFSKWEEKRTVFQMKFKDKSPVFKALRGSELLNQLEIWRWKNENFYLLAMPLSYFSVRVNFIKRNISMQRKKKGNDSQERKMSSFIWVHFVDDFNIPSRSEVLWGCGEDFEKLFLKYMRVMWIYVGQDIWRRR